MTRWMRVLPCLALAAGLCACGSKDHDGDPEEDATEDGEEDVAGDVEEEDGSTGPSTFEDEVRVEPGAAFAIHIDPDGVLVPDDVLDPLSELSATSASAVEASPEWIRDDLARTLWHLDVTQADTLANEIVSAEALQVDEVAWSIAHTSPEILAWMVGRGYAGIFRENAQGVYAVDGSLLYARLVELEDRTTVELDGEMGTFQLDPDMYYHYVVYPRGYMDLPMYFDGQFWRSLFQLSTPTAPPVVNAVSTATSVQEAADMVGDWIQAIMTFGYGTNEIQPVEVYQNRFGSCGQYSIFTTAVARTVFIPTASVSARADDHEWNEFWDERWIMWDNSLGEIGSNPHHPYIDWPHIFDDDLTTSGVMGEVAHVLRFRTDGNIFACDQYTGYDQQVSITVLDSAGATVEGVRVIARTTESGYLPATWDYTDHHGVVSFMLGDDLQYGFTSDHPVLGMAPTSGVGPVLRTYEGADPVDDFVSFSTAYTRSVTDAGPPPEGDISLTLEFQVARTLQQRVNVITEGYDLGHTYPAGFDGGVIDVFIVDQAGYEAFYAGSAVSAHSVHLAAEEGSLDLTLPSGQDWYIVLDNALWPVSTKFVSVSATSAL